MSHMGIMCEPKSSLALVKVYVRRLPRLIRHMREQSVTWPSDSHIVSSNTTQSSVFEFSMHAFRNALQENEEISV